MLRSCARDEGRPLGIGIQVRVSNQPKLLRYKSRGGERWVKSSEHVSGQVSIQKMSESEPFDDAS